MKVRQIELFAKTNNKRGDLFCRLMGDFFHAIGYEEPRYDIQKSGREIDLTTKHRTESKIAIAECKAHEDTIGGSDINKFIGSLDAEKRKIKKLDSEIETIGYFVSLSGFKETAIEQELDLDNQRLILIDREKIIKELIEGKIIVPIEQAINKLRFNEQQPDLLNEVDLIAHSIGWIWVIYYGVNNTKTHFSFVHAEGKPLLDSLSLELIEFDKKSKKLFNKLTYLTPLNEIVNNNEKQKIAKEKYFQYIKNECGNIQFEGLPTDKEVGSVKVDIEQIFQPLHLEEITASRETKNNIRFDESIRQPIGEILRKNTRLAILAKPGGGKSTLLKRIAVAYSFHERLGLVDDNLPEEKWMPIFIRCRELGEFVTKSITEIIENIPNRAEIGFCKEGFSELISNSLQNGTALLLIDGLDEISEDNNRLVFVNQLRTFLATYPNIHIITTSREAGFRVIGGVLANYCKHYKISSLIPDEITELVIKWHKAVIDNSDKTVNDAIELSKLILKDKRIRVLAENPLLLTTLLFVKRWAGYIPTKRSLLYEEMIKLLLVTWNVEGHEQLDIDEAEPQLAFVAYWMTENGNQTITLDDLKTCLLNSRREMPEILGYTKVSISEFIKRVESRSSLLIQSGHKKLDNGRITPIYEFLHLSFQEYLTAKAVVDKFIPRTLSNKSNLEIIKPNINKENWKEVVPLIAVLSKRGTNELIEYLIQESKALVDNNKKEFNNHHDVLAPDLLGNCIANEIQINPELLKLAIEWFAKNRYNFRRIDLLEIILNSKFSILFYETIYNLYFVNYEDKYCAAIGSLLGEIFLIQNEDKDLNIIYALVSEKIINGKRNEKAIGFLTLMIITFRYFKQKREMKIITEENFIQIENELMNVLQSNDIPLISAATWCIAWLGDKKLFFTNRLEEFAKHLTCLWLNSTERNSSRYAVWALFTTFDLKIDLAKYKDMNEFTLVKFENKINDPTNEYDKIMGLYIGTILGYEFKNIDINSVFKEFSGRLSNKIIFNEMARYMKLEIKA